MALTEGDRSVVYNMRCMFRQQHKRECTLTDEQIARLRRDCIAVDLKPGETEDDVCLQYMLDDETPKGEA